MTIFLEVPLWCDLIFLSKAIRKWKYSWCLYCTKLAPTSKQMMSHALRAWGFNADEVLAKLFFGRKGFAKTSAHLFLNSDVANGKGRSAM